MTPPNKKRGLWAAAAIFGALLGAGLLGWAQNLTVKGAATINGSSTFAGAIDTGCTTVECGGGDWTTCSCAAGYYIRAGGCTVTTSPYFYQASAPMTGGGSPSQTVWTCGGQGGNKIIDLICCRAR